MTRSEYYASMKALAQEKRKKYGIATSKITLPVIKKIYKKEGVKIDYRKLPAKIRAAYFCDGDDCSVLVNRRLPREPKLFSMVHELKHHFLDREAIENGEIKCGDYNANEVIEKGAEVFAAEFIFPEHEMREAVSRLGIDRSNCIPKSVVDFKREKLAPVSYTFIKKRFEFFGLIQPGQFNNVQFEKLKEEIYGVPFYKQDWFKRRRKSHS